MAPYPLDFVLCRALIGCFGETPAHLSVFSAQGDRNAPADKT